MSRPVPKRLGRYEIQEEIGRGMMGVVYRARDPELDRVVALKTVQLAWAISDEERQNFERRFMAEAKVAASLSHPGIVVVHDIGRDTEAKAVFIAMECLTGRTLGEMTSNGTHLEWREALKITAQVAEALHHAHAAGIVHRDIKPANIMVTSSGEPKIMDFGIAKVPASQLTTVGEFFGTPSYMSPEQASGAPVDSRSDIFSLGSVLYLLLTGHRAFDAVSVPLILARLSDQDPARPTSVLSSLPLDVDYLIARALAKSVDDRYATGQQFAEDCDDVRDGRPPRHRAGWVEPPRLEGTLNVSLKDLVEPETADLRRMPPGSRGGAGAWFGMPRRTWMLLSVLFVLCIAAAFFYGREGRAPSLTRPLTPRPSPVPDPVEATPEAPSSEPAVEASSPIHLPLPMPFVLDKQKPAQLDVTLDHSLKWGRVRVWVDDTLVMDKPLVSHLAKKIVVLKEYRGHFHDVVAAPPGDHLIRARVEGDGFDESRRIRGDLKSAETARLTLDVGGVLTRSLEIAWAP